MDPGAKQHRQRPMLPADGRHWHELSADQLEIEVPLAQARELLGGNQMRNGHTTRPAQSSIPNITLGHGASATGISRPQPYAKPRTEQDPFCAGRRTSATSPEHEGATT